MKILLVGNDASRTGAPLVLLYFLRWLKANTDWECHVLLRNGAGGLREAYEALAPTLAYDGLTTDRSFLRRAARKMGIHKMGGKSCLSGLEQYYQEAGLDVILAHTITQGGILSDLSQLDCPAITYTHELESMFHKYGETNLAHVMAHSVHYIAGSRAVERNLVEHHQVDPASVDTVHGFTSGAELDGAEVERAAIRESLNIPGDAVMILGSGFRNWRKGKDLFIQLAYRVLKQNRPAHFVWVGGTDGDEEFFQAEHDIRHAGLEGRVHLVPEVSNHAAFSAACDVLATMSREDPFPLTNLEAGYFGKPVVCFDGAGGTPEFVESDAGFVVPYLDLVAMAEKIIVLCDDAGLRDRLGRRAAEKMRERHDVSTAGPRLKEIIERVVKGAR